MSQPIPFVTPPPPFLTRPKPCLKHVALQLQQHFDAHIDPSCSLHKTTNHVLYWIGTAKTMLPKKSAGTRGRRVWTSGRTRRRGDSSTVSPRPGTPARCNQGYPSPDGNTTYCTRGRLVKGKVGHVSKNCGSNPNDLCQRRCSQEGPGRTHVRMRAHPHSRKGPIHSRPCGNPRREPAPAPVNQHRILQNRRHKAH